MDICKEHFILTDKINAMHGDVKVLVSEFKAMNGTLRDTKINQEKHQDESQKYRHKIDTLWSVIHTIKWAIVLLFGSGMIWKVLEFLQK